MSAALVEVTAEQARSLTDRIKVAVEGTWQLITQAYTSRAYTALGYANWDDYCIREFGTSRLRLPREERAEVVASLRESGFSIRAIVAATGVTDKTVMRDLRQVSETPTPQPDPIVAAELDQIEDETWLTQEDCEALDRELSDSGLAREAEAVETVVKPRVIGTDGKSYPQPPKPAPLTEAERIARRKEQDHKDGLRRQVALMIAFLDSWHCASTLRISAWRDEILAELSESDRARFLAIETQFAAIERPARNNA